MPVEELTRVRKLAEDEQIETANAFLSQTKENLEDAKIRGKFDQVHFYEGGVAVLQGLISAFKARR